MAKSIIVCHIAAASGARFSVHPSEEEFRQSLLEYHNDTLCDDDDEKLHDDAVVSEVIDAIEESENVSRSEEHTSELQSLMRISYAVFCLKQNNTNASHVYSTQQTTHR